MGKRRRERKGRRGRRSWLGVSRPASSPRSPLSIAFRLVVAGASPSAPPHVFAHLMAPLGRHWYVPRGTCKRCGGKDVSAPFQARLAQPPLSTLPPFLRPLSRFFLLPHLHTLSIYRFFSLLMDQHPSQATERHIGERRAVWSGLTAAAPAALPPPPPLFPLSSPSFLLPLLPAPFTFIIYPAAVP